MVTVISHSVAPDNLSILEQELAASLHEITSSENISFANSLGISQAAMYRSDLISEPAWGADIVHVFRPSAADVDCKTHAEFLEERTRRVGVDRKGTSSLGLVMSDEVRLAATNDNDVGRRRQREVIAHRDSAGEGFEVGLAGSAIEVSNENDQLAGMKCIRRLVQIAKLAAAAKGIIYHDLLHSSKRRAIGTFIGHGVRGYGP